MSNRIERSAIALKDQLTQAIAGATALGVGWPADAPTIAEMTTARDNLGTSITDTETKEAAWKVAAQLKKTRVTAGMDVMVDVDRVTDMLYGPDGAQKTSFGLPPKGAPLPPLHKLIEIAVTDGPFSGSVKFDWESIASAAYEIQWSTASNFATMVGSAVASSSSDYVISGLTPGTKYWRRVPPMRGGQVADWRAPATRCAPL
jgi:hypothetical protein